jgi:hypothetical protein
MKEGRTAVAAVVAAGSAAGAASVDVTGMMADGGVVADECRTGSGSGSGSDALIGGI